MAASVNNKIAGYRINETDCMHNSLPLYHSTGLMLGICAVVQAGASTFIKRKFSASSFWDEVQKYNTTALVYIGELCRYLANTDPTPAEQNNPLKVMVETGLDQMFGIFLKIDSGLIELLRFMEQVKETLCL